MLAQRKGKLHRISNELSIHLGQRKVLSKVKVFERKYVPLKCTHWDDFLSIFDVLQLYTIPKKWAKMRSRWVLSKPLQSLGLQLLRSCMWYIWEAVLWQSIGPQQYNIDVMLIQLRNGHLRSSINHIFCIRSSIDLRIHQKILCHNTNRIGMPSNTATTIHVSLFSHTYQVCMSWKISYLWFPLWHWKS